MGELCILVVGRTDRTEFREARAALEAWGQVRFEGDPTSAARALGRQAVAPDLIVVAQAYSGQYSPEAIERLQHLAPLARVVALLGSWCEGEARTGKPWSGAIRVYWHQWLARCGQELERLRGGAGSTWALPITAGEEERFMVMADAPLPRREGLVVIATGQFEMYEWLSAACAKQGYSTAWFRRHAPPRVEGAVAAIFDPVESPAEDDRTLELLTGIPGEVPILALLDFPRSDDRHRLLAAGARTVLSKPVLIEDLFWEIDRLREAS